MGSESEPPNWATETNTDCGVFQARNPKSPVRIRGSGTPKARGIAGISPPIPRCEPEVSAAADEMAEQVEFELSVLFGESGANPNRVTWRPRNSNSRYGSSESRPSLGRIKSESEPPNLPTEKNAGSCAFDAPNPPSPVRIREGRSAKTPRIRAVFSRCTRARAGSLCNSRLNGGGTSL